LISFENEMASDPAGTASILVEHSLGRKSFENERPSGSAATASVHGAFFFLCRNFR
jgi:hypothetical protein